MKMYDIPLKDGSRLEELAESSYTKEDTRLEHINEDVQYSTLRW